jgi:two-component system sensor histidine kinase KdpD
MSELPAVALTNTSSKVSRIADRNRVRNLEKRRQKREIEKKNREFMAMVAHDIQTPLAVVTGSVSALRDGLLGQLPDAAMDRITATELAVSELTQLINDFLDAQIWMHGAFSMSLRPVELSLVLTNAVRLFRQTMYSNPTTISLSAVPAQVIADSHRLTQVVLNLLSNAVKHAPEGRHIRIECQCTPSEAIVTVTNEGKVLTSEMRETMFEKFSRFNHDSRGAGLGLAICKYIVEAHGGKIIVAGAGDIDETSFSFTLPLVVS